MSFNPAQLLGRARLGIEPVDLPSKIKASALVHLEDWLGVNKFGGLLPRSDYVPARAVDGGFEKLRPAGR